MQWGLNTLTVGIWIALLVIVLVLTYFYRRDQKERKKKAEEKVAQFEEKKDAAKGYTIVIKENGSLKVLFEDGKAGERATSGRIKNFVDRRQMIKFLGKAITYDFSEIIPNEKGTYVIILYVWKHKLTPIEDPELTGAALSVSCKLCKPCGIQNDGDAVYCKKCGKKLC